MQCGIDTTLYNIPIQLCGQDLPWVQTAVHLGHELHQLGTMEYDVSMKRAQYIETAMDMQETFKFGRPQETLRAVQVYGGHWYGSMLWDQFGEEVGQLCKSWNTSVKAAWGLLRSTHTFITENLLARDFLTAKQQLVGRCQINHRKQSSADST